MSPASASGIAVLYRSILVPDRGTPYSGTGMVPASAFLSFRDRIDLMPDSPTFGIFKTLYKGEKGYNTLRVYTGSDGFGYTLHVHTADGGKGYTPCTSILLAVKKDTPCMSILMAVDMDTRRTSMLLAVEMNTPSTWCYSCYRYMMLKNHK